MIWSSIETAIGLVARHPDWALFAAFMLAILEAVAVLGTFIPGTYLFMAVTGAAAAAGQPMLPFLAVAIAGAVIGDFLSFWFGARYATTLRGLWPFSRWPELLRRADRFFERFGVASVAICRFIPVLRSMVPLVAGMTGMRRRDFLLANVSSAFVWAPAHVYPAQLAGLMMEAVRQGDWVAVWLWGGVLAACLVAIWALHRVIMARTR
jgi:membrane protein DedA with SNARE-associated domain